MHLMYHTHLLSQDEDHMTELSLLLTFHQSARGRPRTYYEPAEAPEYEITKVEIELADAKGVKRWINVTESKSISTLLDYEEQFGSLREDLHTEYLEYEAYQEDQQIEEAQERQRLASEESD